MTRPIIRTDYVCFMNVTPSFYSVSYEQAAEFPNNNITINARGLCCEATRRDFHSENVAERGCVTCTVLARFATVEEAQVLLDELRRVKT